MPADGGAPKKPSKEARRRAYEQERLARDVRQGKEERAAARLERIWTEQDDATRLERLRWLIHHWPEQAERDLAALPDALLDGAAFTALVADEVLLLSEGLYRVLSRRAPACLDEARAVRRALAAVCEGDDERGLSHLRSIGLRSPFRPVRSFLRGLSAFWRGEDEECARALRPLVTSPAYGRLARTLRRALGEEHGEPTPALQREDRALLEALGAEDLTQRGLLDELRSLLEEGRPNQAIRSLSQLLAAGGTSATPLVTALHRDLPGALLRKGLPPREIVARIARALPDPPGHRGHAHMAALLLDTAGHHRIALDAWSDYAQQLRRGAVSLPGVDPSAARALVYRQIGEGFARLAADEADIPFSPFGRRRGSQRPCFEDESAEDWAAARKHLERAVELAPTDVQSWLVLVEAARHQKDGKRAGHRVIERFVKALPEHPQALLQAAEAAAERGAFDKGRRYVRRAVELEPLNRTARDIEARMLRSKARKKLKAEDWDAALGWTQEALELEGGTPEGRLETNAAAAMLFDLLGQPQRGLELRSEALGAGVSPWRWSTLAGREKAELLRTLGSTRKLARLPGFASDRCRLDVVALPEAPPRREDVELLVRMADEDDDSEEGISPTLYDLLQRALEEGGTLLGTTDDILVAAGFCEDDELELRMYEHGLELHPSSAEFLGERYALAMELGKPPSYFDRAAADAAKVLDALGASTDPEEGQPEEPTAEDLLARLARGDTDIRAVNRALERQRVREIVEQVERYVGHGRKRRGRSSASKRRDAASAKGAAAKVRGRGPSPNDQLDIPF